MQKKNIVVIKKENHWDLQYDNGEEIESNLKSEKEAVELGKDMAAKEHVDVVIKDNNGKIKNVISYGGGSFPVQGYG